MENNKMTVLVVEPQMQPYIKEIDPGLKFLQNEVGGLIQAVYPFEEPVAIICNEEGKLNGLPLNRALRDDDGHMYDIIAGTFLVVGLGEEDFCSLNEQHIKQFSKLYKTPEMFLRANGKILVMPMQWDTIKDDRPSVAEKLKTAPRKDVLKTPSKDRKPER